ncbi:dTDP-4-dehydrorhamnose reductase family protein [Gloeobacter kilaueensis]|uniref:dTDP-4-dehydrorhamnose reductase n=1 Tax=Gloeobacter kilaueensis (strain ATCC BAA-2537 / CCAP 1431/1 / ULC 316 / JS1) TaxID=1183438 RepID=U5QNV5_GLOK1|nr:SDR family oxidoreductase [Gloeobacter kilaueensis]AGY60682.1 dTDP-4-dehydrorhamnose reductase [Gloeobacter kilaueensis JS1]
MPRLLLTGVSGLLGYHVAFQALDSWEVRAIAGRRPLSIKVPAMALDLATAGAEIYRQLLEQIQPQAVIHCAAMSESAQCEQAPERAFQVNVEATDHLARAAARVGSRFIFVSTDLVFDGRAAPYTEASPTGPLGCYARTKRLAEERVLGYSNALVVRTSLLLGPSPSGERSVEERLGAQLRSGKPAQLFTDEYRSPIHAADLAAALLELAWGNYCGLLHVGGRACVSRYELGWLLARHFGWDARLIAPALGRDFPSEPPRPANVCLDSRRAYELLARSPRPLAQIYPPL